VKVVLDTNVLVSAFLKPGRAPDRVVQRALRGEVTAVFDQRMLVEYVEVLGRTRFGFDPKDTLRVLLRLITTGERSRPPRLVDVPLPDPDDLPFIEVAAATGAVIVTGNARDFAPAHQVRVLSPRELLDELGPERIVVRAMPYNVEQRLDGDWGRVDDGSHLAGTIHEWEQYCTEKGFQLVIERDGRKSTDPYEGALRNMARVQAALHGPVPRDRRPLADRKRLRDDLVLTLTWAFPIPRRFSGLKGVLRMLHAIAQRRGCNDEIAAEAISRAVSNVVARGGDTVESWDVCGHCRREFRYRRFSRAMISRMLASGYGALCERCA